MKNCGEVVHQAVAETGIVHDMVKTVKKKVSSNFAGRIIDIFVASSFCIWYVY